MSLRLETQDPIQAAKKAFLAAQLPNLWIWLCKCVRSWESSGGDREACFFCNISADRRSCKQLRHPTEAGDLCRRPIASRGHQQGAKDASKGDIQESYLPKIIFRMVTGQDGHRCQCKDVYNPEFDEKVLQLAMEKVRDQDQAGLEDAEKEEIRARYYKKYAQTINEEARNEIAREASDTTKQQQKDAERKAWKREIQVEESREVRGELESIYLSSIRRYAFSVYLILLSIISNSINPYAFSVYLILPPIMSNIITPYASVADRSLLEDSMADLSIMITQKI